MRANHVIPDPDAPGNLKQRVEALAEAAAEAGEDWLSSALIDALDRADAPFDDVETPDDIEPDLGWLNPEGELPHTYREPRRRARTDEAYVDADGDLSGGCAGEASQ